MCFMLALTRDISRKILRFEMYDLENLGQGYEEQHLDDEYQRLWKP